VPCTVLHDRNCSNCSNCTTGFFEFSPCTNTTDRVCHQCSNCTGTQQVLIPCNATHDVVCIPCPDCANCTLTPNSHVSNNGQNCTCNEGYSEQMTDLGLHCLPTPCCGDCLSCGFNSSTPCFAPNPSLCNYSCEVSSQCTLGTTPAQTGFGVAFNGVTYDGACCAAGVGPCSCFTYGVSASAISLQNFILGVSCSLSLCAPFVSPPCLDSVAQDGVTLSSGVFITNPSDRDPLTGVFGILLQGIDVNAGQSSQITFVFQGDLNISSIPITVAATGNPASSEADACLVTSVAGPACVDCTLHP